MRQQIIYCGNIETYAILFILYFLLTEHNKPYLPVEYHGCVRTISSNSPGWHS